MQRTLAPHERSELESQIGRAIIHFEKEYMGRGPLETKTWLLEDMILVRLKGVLTPAERKLSESQSDRSSYLLKQVRNELLSSGRHLLETVIRDIVGIGVLSFHTDISTKTGERIIVVTLQEKLRFERGGGEGSLCRPDSRNELTYEAPSGPKCEATSEDRRGTSRETGRGPKLI